jgi:hypothetical protein
MYLFTFVCIMFWRIDDVFEHILTQNILIFEMKS